MNIVVLKFGGSSVANNENLNIVAEKIIKFKNENKDVVVIVSAQGKTTDKLIKEAKEINETPSPREVDMLLSVGEQISAAKLAMTLQNKGIEAISLNAWQAKLYSDGVHQKAKIISIDKSRIINELSANKVVVITGFQGIDANNNINTLGRGGSDTTAVAIAHTLKANKCYIFSDVDGIYSADPRKEENAIKIKSLSFDEMQNASFEGAKVLHDRCVMLANKYNLPIISASTFSEEEGSIIQNENVDERAYRSNDSNDGIKGKNDSHNRKNIQDDKLEEEKIKTIIKNDNMVIVKISNSNAYNILKDLNNHKITFGNFEIFNKNQAYFTILENDKNLVDKILGHKIISSKKVTKISVVCSGISNNKEAIGIIISSLEQIKDKIIFFETSALKISILFSEIIDDKFLNVLHKKLIKN